jgi:hypothetical protein
MRSIVVDDVAYLWRREHVHADAGCVELLTVIASRSEPHHGARLTLRFRARDGWAAGVISAGVLRRQGDEPVNLNRPAVVAALVRRARSAGWPLSRRTLDEENAHEWLACVPRGE